MHHGSARKVWVGTGGHRSGDGVHVFPSITMQSQIKRNRTRRQKRRQEIETHTQAHTGDNSATDPDPGSDSKANTNTLKRRRKCKHKRERNHDGRHTQTQIQTHKHQPRHHCKRKNRHRRKHKHKHEHKRKHTGIATTPPGSHAGRSLPLPPYGVVRPGSGRPLPCSAPDLPRLRPITIIMRLLWSTCSQGHYAKQQQYQHK